MSSVLDVVTKTCDDNAYGQVHSGFLRIRGPLRLGTAQLFASKFLLFWPGKAEQGQDVAECVFDTNGTEMIREVWCLQITSLHGLMLQSVLGSPDMYERLGVFFRIELGAFWKTLKPETLDWFTDKDTQTITII
jgi:hypothetical protein